jgi:hypothetical protein
MPRPNLFSMLPLDCQWGNFGGNLLDMGVINTNSMQWELGADAGLLIRLIFYTNFSLSVTHPRLRRQKQEFSSCGQIRHHFPLTRGLTTNEPHLFSFPLSRYFSFLFVFFRATRSIPCYLAHFSLLPTVLSTHFCAHHYFAASLLLNLSQASPPTRNCHYIQLNY